MTEARTKAARWLLVGAVAAITLTAISQHSSLGAAVHRVIGFFREAGPWPFFVAMAVLPLAGFPLAPFTVVAGPVFGPTMGVGNVIACAILAVAVNAAASYWIAVRGLRPMVWWLARVLGYTVPELPVGSVWEIALLVRILPGLPFFLQSYALGIARVPFGIYLVVSTLVPAVYLTAGIMAGDAMMRGDRWMLLGAGVICAVAGIAVHRLRQRLRTRPRPQ